MKKLKNLISCLLIAIVGLVIGYTIWIPESEDKERSNPIAVMLENDSGNYELSTDNALYPGAMYTFNEEKSSCVNGSTITFQNGNISLNTNGTDNCTLYYDKLTSSFNISLANDSEDIMSKGGTGYDVTVSCTGATAEWNYITWSLDVSAITSAQASCSIKFTTNTTGTNLYSFIENNVGTTQGDGKIVDELGYRYEGVNPNNYVYFNGELWRIVGISEGSTNISIIKNESIGTFPYNTLGNDTSILDNYNNIMQTQYGSSISTKSSIMVLLSYFYYNSTDATNTEICRLNNYKKNCDFTSTGIKMPYRNMINIYNYNCSGAIGGVTNAAEVYIPECMDVASRNIYTINLSDYGFSVLSSSCSRNTSLSSYNSDACAGSSWMSGYTNMMTYTEHTNGSNIFKISSNGSVTTANKTDELEVLPVVNLKDSVYIRNGSGTLEDPYVLNG